jgi:hypothetical protein
MEPRDGPAYERYYPDALLVDEADFRDIVGDK